MPKRKRSPEPSPQDLESSDLGAVETETLPEPSGNGHEEAPEVSEAPEASEPPAKMRVQIEGTAGAVRAAARKVGNSPVPVVATPASDVEPPGVDETDVLLADGRNMVVVQRQFPKSVSFQDGSKRRCAVKLPDRYGCPTTREEIENDVFDRHGGKKYKCTIHPATTNGESTILGFFTIEHPDPEAMPIFEDDQQPPMQFDPRTSLQTDSSDKTMHETDGLSKLKADLERRVERARVKKEMRELEDEVKRMEESERDGDRKPVPVVVPSENPEIQKLREENARLQASLAEKKVSDRFDKLEGTIGELAKTLTAFATAKPAPAGEDPAMKFILKKMDSDSAQITELMKALTARQAAPTTPPVTLDSALDTIAKVKGIVAPKEDSSISDFKEQLIQASIDRLNGGGDEERGPADEEDAFKFALKQMTPVIKAYVEKKVGQREDDGKPPNEEELKKIYEEAGKKAAQEIASKWEKEGLVVRAEAGRPGLPPPAGGKQPPPRTIRQGDRPGVVTGVQDTSEGRVKTVRVQPHDFSNRKAPAPSATDPATTPEKKEEAVKYTELPGLGEGGAALKVELPAQPGDMKYDRKRSVNFILDSIRSEILKEVPVKSPDDSYVVGDALELLDDEILSQISKVETGEQLEAALGPWCDAGKIASIKESGNRDEATKSWLRRIFITISDNFKDYKRKAL